MSGLNIAWTHVGPAVLAAFLASLVEFVEALTVILAVGTTRGWRAALTGAAAATGTLAGIVALLGPAVTRIPLTLLQAGIGTLLLLFGMRWLRKAILRSAGVIPLHDETAAFAHEVAAMRRLGRADGWDRVAFGATFQITLLEGTEVVFIVIAIGAGQAGLLLPASLGALCALLLVALLGFVVHRPLASIPENALKFIVGVVLSAFGSFWVGEGLGLAWPGSDWSVLGLIAGFLAAAWMAVPLCRSRVIARPTQGTIG